ncbi:BTAD domain-containing putative transcriptional regulator [Actinoplanes sp. GCM10030250]|uniref:AfsR/SARP family transcriptional regulator n=1 Tax=Actinoplanes sp. GCM10030250 TaxID=3273376 RepID=UPI00360C0430
MINDGRGDIMIATLSPSLGAPVNKFARGVEFRLLGSVGIWQGERQLGPATPQQRTVLAMLLLDAGRMVSLDRLSTALWGSEVPALARNGVQGCVSKIRRVLELVGPPSAELELTTLGMGYCLKVPWSSVDLLRFREAVRAAGVSDPAEAHALLRSGLSQWRGPALSEVAGSWLADNVVPELEEERLSALEQRIALDLVRRRDQDVVKELSALIVEFPWREHLVCLQGITLHRCGRRVEALALLRRWRRRFVDELGIEPGRAFQDLHQALLDDRESTLPLPVPGGALEVTLSPPRVTPDGPTIRQLPAVTTHLVGRRKELRALDTDEGGGISVISGTAGVGKTTLALHWAQQASDRFPDGQLHLDLRGFGPKSTPARPAEALRTMLRILQVPAERTPGDLDGQISLYRGRRSTHRLPQTTRPSPCLTRRPGQRHPAPAHHGRKTRRHTPPG